MTRQRTRLRARTPLALSLIGLLTAGLLTACTTEETTIIAGSSVHVAAAEPFLSLNDRSRWGNTGANRNIVAALNSSIATYNSVGELEFDDSFGTAEIIDNNPFTVRYTVAPTATWSDGVPVDASDLLLAWAANSAKLNDLDFDPSPFINNDTGEWLRATPPGVVWFDGAVSEGLHHVSATPTPSEDRRSIDFEFDHYFVDWALVIHVGLPAHVVAQRALRIDDPHDAREALIDAILTEDRGALAPLARTWNTGFTIEEIAADATLRVTNGPYVIDDITVGETVTLTANKNYRGSHQPHYETVIVSTLSEPGADLVQLADGSIDVAVIATTPEVITELQSLNDTTLTETFTAGYSHLDLLMSSSLNGHIENPLVREALLHTVPVDGIAAAITEQTGIETYRRHTHLFMPGQQGYSGVRAPLRAITTPDIDRARELLAEAGIPSPVICLLYDRGNPTRVAEYGLIRDSAALAGIRVTDCGTYELVGLLGTARSYDAALFAWNQNNLSVTALRATYGTGGLVNLNRYTNDEAERILGELELEADPEAQLPLRAELDAQLWDDHYGMPLYQTPLAVAVRDTVTGVRPAPLMRGILWNLWEWSPLLLNAPSPSP
ncbi:MAG TPA: ABC transporter substrate-binding protein [Terrimesophilobacter sp.]|nr:ABC transporter substrate-binding protein [Terrimesophilobacter sp.]